MSKSLVRILDYSIFPASVLILAKFLGVILVARYFNIAWSLRDYTGSVFAVSTVLKAEDVILVTSYSDLFMYVVAALFFSIAVFRTIFLHNTHANEMVILSLSKLNLLNLIKDSYTVYGMTAGWWIFMVLSNALIWINISLDKTYSWIGVLTTLSSFLLSFVLFLDVYREISLIRKHPSKYKWH